jgi:hypothetical protein
MAERISRRMRTSSRLLIAFSGSALVLGFGIALSNLFSLEQDVVLFPTSVLYKCFPPPTFGSDAYPLSVRIAIVALHLLIWTAIIFVVGQLYRSLRTPRPHRR